MSQTFVVTAPDGHDYEITAPDGATQDEALAYAKSQFAAGALTPAAPAAPAPVAAPSQSDVRKVDNPSAPPALPMAGFNQKADEFSNLIQRYIKETGGKLQPGQTIRQATAAYFNTPDPEPQRGQAEIANLKAGGDLQYGGSVAYNAAKTLASMYGFATGGPIKATALETGVRQVSLIYNLSKAIDNDAVTPERAAEIFAKESGTGFLTDAAWNLALPVLGELLGNTPGVRKVIAAISKRMGGTGAGATADLTDQTARKVASRAALAEGQGPAAQQAVQELTTRAGGQVPTPAEVTGSPGFAEGYARVAKPVEFAKHDQLMKDAAEGLRSDVLNPASQPSREAMGSTIQDLADQAQTAVKKRLRPVFKAADQSGVQVDFTDVLNRAKAALASDAAVPGGKLAAPEKAALQEVVRDLEGLASPAQPAGAAASGVLDASGKPIMTPTPAVAAKPPVVDAETALDFISRQKEKLRSTTADWKPSKFYDGIVNGMTQSADQAFEKAAQSAGQSGVAEALSNARDQYRNMMGTVYEDAMKQALKKNPEDVGRLFWQRGNVSEPKQLHQMLAMAQREGVASVGNVNDLNRAMARGFLQEAVPNVDAAAKWSKMLAEKPGLRDTWNVLTSTPGGAELRSTMDVLEKAAQMAQRDSPQLIGQLGMAAIPIRRAVAGGMGISYVTGVVHLPLVAAAFSVDGLMKMMGTAYMEGNKGVMNAVARGLRANGAGTAAGAKALEALVPQLQAYAEKHGINILIPQPSGPSEPEPPAPPGVQQ